MMNDLENRLNELKSSYQEITAPADLENRMRSALQGRHDKTRSTRRWAAAVVMIFLLFGYSWDAMAYYGKKLLGYEQVATGSASELIQSGKGQSINKSAQFSNGITVTLDGLIMDGKGFTTLIKVEYPEGYIKKPGDTIQYELKGLLTYVRGSGSGEIKGNTEYWSRTFDDEPMLLEKRMQLIAQRTENGQPETIRIPFVLNRQEAYVPTVSTKKIGVKIETPYGTVHFDRLQASALSTVVEGRITGGKGLVPVSSSQHRSLSFNLKNGDQLLNLQGSSMSSGNDRDYKFEYQFAGIKEVKGLTIVDLCFTENYDMEKIIDLKPGMKPVELGDDKAKITLTAVTAGENNTMVVFSGSKDITPVAGFFLGDKQVEAAEVKQVQGNRIEWHYKVEGKGITLHLKSLIKEQQLKESIEIK